ncbi:bacteriohemerythrin [Massilia sp. BJB1822]|uniref:bacteriohemerythrin n=1 Tax=Massilia sp. BJB1822 TaxID=2744470 RepID=UPI0015949593|nr:hemerythrin family protein [Massilia sp. BJB1822]NVE01282.1 hemerythrin family protein [Massilia sp. BJB1822]
MTSLDGTLGYQPGSLGIAALDEPHRTLLRQFAILPALDDERFQHAFGALCDTIGRDFREEEDMMEAIDFPGLAAHREQHARVLAGLHHSQAALLHGDYGPARRAAVLLPDWFELHISTMDAVLAMALAWHEARTAATPA